MDFKLLPGTSAAALGIIGTGVALAFPEEKVLGFVIIAVGALVFLFGIRVEGWQFRFSHRGWRARLNPYYFVATVGALVCIGALFAAWMDHRRGPIIWTWAINSPIQFNGGGTNQGIWVFSFNFNGKNRWGDPITVLKAEIISNETTKRIPLSIATDREIIPADMAVIRPFGEFTMSHVMPDQKMPLSEFRAQYPSFTLVFEYVGGNATHRFDGIAVQKMIEAAEREYITPPRLPGAVRVDK